MSHYKVHKLDSSVAIDKMKFIVRTPLNHSATTGYHYKCNHWVANTAKLKKVV